MPYETGTAAGHIDLVEKMRKFITGYGVAGTPAYTGTGDGVIYHVDTDETSISETWTITCTAAAVDGGTFSVVGSVSGAKADAEVGTLYDNGLISFLINDGAVDFIVSDFFTIAVTEGALKTAGQAWILDSQLSGKRVDYFASSEDAVNYAINALDGVKISALFWRPDVGSISGSFLGVELIEPLAIGEVSITCSTNTTYTPKDFTIQYSDDGLTYYDAVVITGETGWSANETRHYSTTLGATDKHKFYRVQNQAGNNATRVDFSEIEMWEVGDTGRTDNFARQVAEETILHGEGLSGTDAIYVGIKPFKGGADASNIEIRGYSGYSAAQAFDQQPGVSPPTYNLLSDVSMPYWIVANGRRVIVVAKISTVYVAFHFGFILPYGTPAQYPYPLHIGGSNDDPTQRWSDTDADHSHFVNPGNNGSYLRDVSGAWLEFVNYSGSGSYINNVYPFGGNSSAHSYLDTLRTTPDNEYALLPLVLLSQTPESNLFGEIDGAFFVSGFGNAAENIITIGGVDHLVVQNVHRTSANDYWALKLE